jgi:heterodisulfide reductase subunit A-like polyferredoxin
MAIEVSVDKSLFLQSAAFLCRALKIPSKQTTLSITFLVIGAGVSGLACAMALRRVGHKVVVIEREKKIGESDVRLHLLLFVA